MAFLLCKALLAYILQSRAPDTDPQALANFFFEAINTVNEQFNSHCKVLWPLYLEKLAGEPRLRDRRLPVLRGALLQGLPGPVPPGQPQGPRHLHRGRDREVEGGAGGTDF